MDTVEDKMIALIPCKLFDACLRALSPADAKVRAGSSRTCSIILIDGNNPFSKTAISKHSQAKMPDDLLDGAVYFDSASSRVKRLLMRVAY